MFSFLSWVILCGNTNYEHKKRNKFMNLIKSKINSLAGLKSAIYISVVGGVILSSMPVSAAFFALPPSASETDSSISFVIKENTFFEEYETSTSSLKYDTGKYWTANFIIKRIQGSSIGGDTLSIDAFLQHKAHPHQGESPGTQFVLRFFLDTTQKSGTPIKDPRSTEVVHPGGKHKDIAYGLLTANVDRIPHVNSDINNWDLTVNARHVPEPTTMLGTALALGWGGWLKRKNSIKQDKTKSQG
jgi:hypothetical protein